jgi:hypothetical protein
VTVEPPSLLILSFSPIARDARVLKQIERFVGQYAVTTCGFGQAPSGVRAHIQIPDDQPEYDLNGRLITAKLYKQAYWRLSAVRWARRRLSGLQFDVAIANDVEAVPLTLSLQPRYGVLADLHEYSPRLHEENEAWKRRIGPFFNWLCRRYVSKAAQWSTVSSGLSEEYAKEFGFRPTIVTNAAPYADLSPTPTTSPIRLVHSGACLRNRSLHVMIEAALRARNDIVFDLYLTANDPGYLKELRTLAATGTRVTVHHAVPYEELLATLNPYDVGLHVLPPVSFNNQWALPNKFFDYVQARLGILIGPSPEMERYLGNLDLGVVAADFSVDATVAAIEQLTPDGVSSFKLNADQAAEALAGSHQVDIWERMLASQTSGSAS